jgi:hypothetical protein
MALQLVKIRISPGEATGPNQVPYRATVWDTALGQFRNINGTLSTAQSQVPADIKANMDDAAGAAIDYTVGGPPF